MNKIKEKVKSSFDNIKLPDFNMDDLKKRKGMVYIKEEKKNHKKNLIISLSACLAVCVCLFIGLGYFNNNVKVASIIGIDVNPSVELKVNKNEKVLDVIANNDDAKVILEGMDLKGSGINVAVNALIGSMVKNGYIDELANSILISVDNPDSQESEKLRKKIVDELNAFISNGNNISVVSQSITAEDKNTSLAKKYGISVGKLELIEKLIEKNNLYTYETLKDLSINELNLLLGSTTENVTTSGSASEKAYIGKDKALEIALSAASASEATWSEVEMDYDDGLMVYEVEFTYNNREYDYEINATTGDIIKSDREYDDDDDDYHSTTNNSSSTSSSNTSGTTNQSSSTNTSNISTTISQYNAEAVSLRNSINNLTVPSSHSEAVNLYYEWHNKIETLENKIDNYEEKLERMYERGELSRANYKSYENELETIEDILDKLEDNLEDKTNYDD